MSSALLDSVKLNIPILLSYKQNKFNLLREQSEGYSKLLVELTSTLGPSHSSQNARPVETYAVIKDRVRPVWDRVISLIGYFDLDPNRALDIILDVLSQHLATHYTFFLTLLSFSPWTGSYLRPLRDEEVMDTKVEIPPQSFNKKSLDEILALVETNSLSGRLPNIVKSGDARVLGQVLGFKFKYYQVRFRSVVDLNPVTYEHSRRKSQNLYPKTFILLLLY